LGWQEKNNMPHEEDYFEARDGLRLHENRWLPGDDPVAVVAVVHGFIEHSGRYAEVAAELNGHGYAVYAMDLRGHGKSAGPGLFVRSFDDYLGDVELFLSRVREWEPDKPRFLFGHSMGGTIAALLAATRPLDVRGLLLSAPACQVGGGVFPLLRHLAGFVSRVWPGLRAVRFDFRRVSRDPEVVAGMRNDPLVFHGRFPARTGAEILQAASRLRSRMEAIELPFLLMHGTADLVTDVSGSRELHARARSTDKTLELYEGLYHDLLHEPEREQVTADLIEWLAARA
jgi:alpha-beta hydrolase superfamily lysophospholipase